MSKALRESPGDITEVVIDIGETRVETADTALGIAVAWRSLASGNPDANVLTSDRNWGSLWTMRAALCSWDVIHALLSVAWALGMPHLISDIGWFVADDYVRVCTDGSVKHAMARLFHEPDKTFANTEVLQDDIWLQAGGGP